MSVHFQDFDENFGRESELASLLGTDGGCGHGGDSGGVWRGGTAWGVVGDGWPFGDLR